MTFWHAGKFSEVRELVVVYREQIAMEKVPRLPEQRESLLLLCRSDGKLQQKGRVAGAVGIGLPRFCVSHLSPELGSSPPPLGERRATLQCDSIYITPANIVIELRSLGSSP